MLRRRVAVGGLDLQRREILRSRTTPRVPLRQPPMRAGMGPRVARRRIPVAALLLVMGLSLGFSANGQPASEFDVKSAFLPRFLQFVEWTPARERTGPKHVVIAVLGDSAFCRQLPTALAKLPPEDGKVTVFREEQPVKAAAADLVFVCESERSRLGSLVRTLEESRVLTVGESNGFGSGGVMLNLYVASDHRVRFEANTNAAARAGIRLSSHLLRMARIVG
jgi:hypothetical protein